MEGKSMTALTLTLKNWLLNRNSMIFIGNILLFSIMLNTLPFERDVVIGLCILTFVAILWLTEAVHVSITAILVPVLAVGFGIFQTPQALTFQIQLYSYFLVGLR
jgi:solute carrier family 13 (sodium-dependent dicarboxylate transporter), member 2/3/5